MDIKTQLDIELFLAGREEGASTSTMLSLPIAYRLIGLELQEFMRLEFRRKEAMGGKYVPYSDR